MHDRCPETNGSEEKLRKGIEQFNHGHFFEAHETWEELWLAAQEPERTFLQGIIQVAAAFHHFARGNRAGAASLLEAGLEKMERFPADHACLQLEDLRASLRRWIAALAAGSDFVEELFPRIERARRS